MHCIITGFDPFGGAEFNPSQQAVERAFAGLSTDAAQAENISITKVVLATCCNEAWSNLQLHVAQVPSDQQFLVLLTGYADKRERITPERFALNVRNYRITDNRGHQHADEYIDSKAPDALRTNVALPALTEALRDAGLASEISDHAGSFVCNEIYFHALRRWRDEPRCAGVLFIHFPSPENYAKVVSGDTAPESVDALGAFARAIEVAIGFISKSGVATNERSRTSGHSQA